MPKHDPRIDAYIINSADFALPVLQHLRVLVHAACPDVEETMKWSFPNFLFKGEILCSMASFKQHCAFGFWKASLMKDARILLDKRKEAMGSLGKITSLKDLPADRKITGWIKEAMKLTEAGAKVVKAKPLASNPLAMPAFFSAALAKNKKAGAAFEKFNHTQKKEYTEWLEEAKTIPTREKRLATAMEQIAEGKIRHWKYAR
ncbi:MAG: YdeI/OmpD-associated family protein [Bacteroidota bacterium]